MTLSHDKSISNPEEGKAKRRTGKDEVLSKLHPNRIPTVERWKTMIATMKQEPQIIRDLLPSEPGS